MYILDEPSRITALRLVSLTSLIQDARMPGGIRNIRVYPEIRQTGCKQALILTILALLLMTLSTFLADYIGFLHLFNTRFHCFLDEDVFKGAWPLNS